MSQLEKTHSFSSPLTCESISWLYPFCLLNTYLLLYKWNSSSPFTNIAQGYYECCFNSQYTWTILQVSLNTLSKLKTPIGILIENNLKKIKTYKIFFYKFFLMIEILTLVPHLIHNCYVRNKLTFHLVVNRQ